MCGINMKTTNLRNLLNWKAQRNGAFVLVMALIVAGVIVFGFLAKEHKSQLQQTRHHGIELARILSEMPFEQLVYNKDHNGLLAIAKYYLGNPEFAYCVVTDADGINRANAKQSGINIPHRAPPSDPSGWLAENFIRLGNSGKNVIEFQAPILSGSHLNGFVRIAFYEPEIYVSSSHIPFLAAITLPIIVIAGMFIYLLRREMQPLKNLGDVISDSVHKNSIANLQIQADGELSEFVGKVNKFVAVTRDKITDLSDSNRELEASSKLLSYQQAKIQSVLHAMPEGMMVFDEAGNISFSNDKISALFGTNNGELKTDSLEWCKDDSVKEFLHKIIHNPLSNYINDSVEFIPKSFSDKKYIAHAYPLFSPRDRNQIQGTLVLFRDYTEESLAKNARGEFVAHVAHELKNPLNVLAMYSESLLREEGESPEFRIEAVNVIQDEVERLSMLINNLLSITKIEMGSMNIDRQRVKLRDLLEDVFTTVKRSGSDKNLEFKFNVLGDLSSLYVDKELLRIALNNLLSNAVKYSESTGVISLSAEEADGFVHIRVADSGIGIPEKEQPLVFDKFFRSDSEDVRSRTGHGLGLSLVKDIVNLHHGSIHIKSEVGNGTEITITLENNAAMLERAG